MKTTIRIFLRYFGSAIKSLEKNEQELEKNNKQKAAKDNSPPESENPDVKTHYDR